ncbi:MAG: Hsp20/alpha crystallin family protein [Candidatus Kapabacteria bacterium]|nr:Hsp20/alpha crystallin family protein [Ignavibacteriota bacterium]MCW5884658.1 Hsp20/alpha crystallin family protein [Candidatus Kapabacteria bacterium]
MGYYRFDPANGLESVIRQIKHAADEINKGVNIETSAFKPRIDITETNGEFSIYVELPGVDKSQVNISVNDDKVLNIKGTKSRENFEGRTNHMNERKFGEFTRSLQLPEDADIEKIAAKYLNGILELSIPKKEPEQPKVIEVKIS